MARAVGTREGPWVSRPPCETGGGAARRMGRRPARSTACRRAAASSLRRCFESTSERRGAPLLIQPRPNRRRRRRSDNPRRRPPLQSVRELGGGGHLHTNKFLLASGASGILRSPLVRTDSAEGSARLNDATLHERLLPTPCWRCGALCGRGILCLREPRRLSTARHWRPTVGGPPRAGILWRPEDRAGSAITSPSAPAPAAAGSRTRSLMTRASLPSASAGARFGPGPRARRRRIALPTIFRPRTGRSMRTTMGRAGPVLARASPTQASPTQASPADITDGGLTESGP